MTHCNKAFIVVFLAVVAFGCKVSTEPSVTETELDYLPSWSPDGSTIAFTGAYNGVQGIYLVDTAGASLRLLVAGTVNGATWSPDSRWLAYAGADGIYEIKANGDSVKRLTTNSLDYHPSWSPDGKTIAFVRKFEGVMEYNLKSTSIISVFQSGLFPSWHSDGHLVVLSASGSSQVSTYVFYAVLDSANWTALCSFNSASQCVNAAVSPAGTSEREMIYALRPLNDYTQISRISVATGLAIQLTFDGGDGGAWSPDGSRIVYTRTSAGDGGLWVMNSDGSGKRRLTSPS